MLSASPASYASFASCCLLAVLALLSGCGARVEISTQLQHMMQAHCDEAMRLLQLTRASSAAALSLPSSAGADVSVYIFSLANVTVNIIPLLI